MTKNTPGPWEVCAVYPDKERGHSFEPRVSILGACTGQADRKVRLADIPDVPGPDSEEAANARLIAAAPELLEALKQQSALLEWAYTQIVNLKKPEIQKLIQKQAEHSLNYKFDGYLPSATRARAAIAKAEGGGA